jgi:hypothetical protein
MILLSKCKTEENLKVNGVFLSIKNSRQNVQVNGVFLSEKESWNLCWSWKRFGTCSRFDQNLCKRHDHECKDCDHIFLFLNFHSSHLFVFLNFHTSDIILGFFF